MAWFFTLSKEDRILIDSMVVDLKREVAPELTVKRPEALSVNKTTRVLERLIRQFREHDQARHLKYFARGRFFHHVRWSLKDAGFAKDFVDLAIESVLSGVVERKSDNKR